MNIELATGPTQHKWYAVGYQAALVDIAAQLDEGGEDAAREWIKNNTIQPARKDPR